MKVMDEAAPFDWSGPVAHRCRRRFEERQYLVGWKFAAQLVATHGEGWARGAVALCLLPKLAGNDLWDPFEPMGAGMADAALVALGLA